MDKWFEIVMTVIFGLMFIVELFKTCMLCGEEEPEIDQRIIANLYV
jgi:hypothetical protein